MFVRSYRNWQVTENKWFFYILGKHTWQDQRERSSGDWFRSRPSCEMHVQARSNQLSNPRLLRDWMFWRWLRENTLKSGAGCGILHEELRKVPTRVRWIRRWNGAAWVSQSHRPNRPKNNGGWSKVATFSLSPCKRILACQKIAVLVRRKIFWGTDPGTRWERPDSLGAHFPIFDMQG